MPLPKPTYVASVAPSGSTIVLETLDGSGAKTNVVSYATDVVQLIDVRAASGTFIIGDASNTTSALAIGAKASVIQTAIQGLASIGSGNALVTSEYPYQVKFAGALAGLPHALFTVGTGSLSASSSAAPLTAGSTAQQILDVSTNFVKVGAAWSPSGFGLGAGFHVAADGSGLNSGEFTIPVANAGNYSVYYSNSGPSGAGNATTVPWRFFDGATPRGKVIVNQQAVVPNNFTLPGDASDAFQLLATIPVMSGTLRVLVTDQVAVGDIGKLVCVNKIAIVPIDPSANLILTGSGTPAYALATGSGWTGPTSDDYNHSQYSSNTVGGSFTWMFMGLLPGSTYDIYTQWGPFANRTTAAVYSISDGASTLGSVSINQQNTPVADQTLTDQFSNAWPFQKIFSAVTPTSTTLTLTLPVSAGGLYTIASAAVVKLNTAAGYAEPVSSSVANLSTGPPSVTINGSDTRILTDVIWAVDQAPALPFVGFLVPGSSITPTDHVTLSTSNNAIGTAAGMIPGVTNQAVTNCVGKSVGRAMPPMRTMGAGWNLGQLGQGFVPVYANAVKNNVGWQGLTSGLPLTANFLPQYTANTVNWRMDFGQPSAANPTGIDYPLWPQTGTTTVKLDGATAGFMTIAPKPGTTMAFQAMNTGHTTGNLITINFAVDGSNTTSAPQFSIYPPNGLLDICDDADAGRFSTVGPWTDQAFGWNGHCRRNDKVATSKAIFSFGARPAGNWEAALSWVPDPGNTTTAVVVIKVAGIQVATYTVDQTGTPASSATNDYNFTTRHFDGGTAFVSGGGAITVEVHGGTDGYCLADAVRLKFDDTLGSPITPMTDFQVLPPHPDIDPANPPEFHPNLLRTLKGASSLRSMILMDAIFGCTVEMSDYASSSQLYYGGEWGLHQYTITEMKTWPDPNNFWTQGSDFNAALITVTPIGDAPLPLVQGFKPTFPAGIAVKYADWTIGNGHVLDLSTQSGVPVEYDPAHMATNQFACGYHAFGAGALQTLIPTAPCTVTFGRAGIPIDSYFRLCKAVGCTVHLNLTSTVSQACINDIAALYTSILPVGTKFILEISNEPWNFFFPDFFYFRGIAPALGLTDGMEAYAKIASDRHGWMTTALGARSGELIRPLNVQLDVFATAAFALDYCNTNSKPVDLVMVSAYLGPFPTAQTGLDATYEKFAAGNTVDFVDAFLNLSTRYSAVFADWQATAAAQTTNSGRLCTWGVYEGGQSSSNMGGSTSTRELQSFAGRYHPAEFAVTLSYLAMLQHYGATYYNHFCVDQAPSAFQSAAVDVMFGVYYGYDALAGKGDGSDGLHDNRPDIAGAPPGVVDFNTAVSPIGAAYNAWNGVDSSTINFLGIYEENMNFLPNNFRMNEYNGLQVPIPANRTTCTLSPYTLSSGGAKVPGADVPLIAPSDSSAASAIIPPSSYGASAKITGNTNLSGDIAVQIDLTGVVGLKPGGSITFYLEVCGTAINPPDGSGLVVITILIGSEPKIYTGTVCLDSLLPQLV